MFQLLLAIDKKARDRFCVKRANDEKKFELEICDIWNNCLRVTVSKGFHRKAQFIPAFLFNRNDIKTVEKYSVESCLKLKKIK